MVVVAVMIIHLPIQNDLPEILPTFFFCKINFLLLRGSSLYFMINECLPDCWSICIGDVGYNVIGRFHTIVSIGMSTGACQLFSSTWSGVNESLVLVTNSKCSLHRTSTTEETNKNRKLVHRTTPTNHGVWFERWFSVTSSVYHSMQRRNEKTKTFQLTQRCWKWRCHMQWNRQNHLTL